jgi:hypothetical protein
LTRFDITTTATVKSFHHFTVGGEVEIEETEVLRSSVDAIVCRWCGHGRAIEVISASEYATNDEPPGEPSE